jgi:predicted RNA-binding protein associated with RNAse of E/G family
MLNRKYADLRHAPGLDPRVLRYEPAARPQAVVRLGPKSRRKVKAGVVLGDPGFTWALFLHPGQWHVLTAVYDTAGGLVAHYIDLCTPPEEQGGILTFVDLKLDLLVMPDGDARWLDREDYEAEVHAGRIPAEWQVAVADTVTALDRERRAGRLLAPEVLRFRPPAG